MLNLMMIFMLSSILTGSGNISAIIVDDQYDAPLPEVSVQLLDVKNQSVISETITDARGEFKFNSIMSGYYFINASLAGFEDHEATVKVENGKTANIGKLCLKVYDFYESHFSYKGIQVFNSDGTPYFRKKRPVPIDVHLRRIRGVPVMNVCEYIKLRKNKPLDYSDPGVIIVGTLEKKGNDSLLRQTCDDSLKSGSFIWPNAIAMKDAKERKNSTRVGNIKKPDWNSEFVPLLEEIAAAEIEAWDGKTPLVAVYGKLDTRENLVAAPCGKDQICGYGYGPASAPAQITYRHIYYLSRPER